ncbi:MAG: NADH-quinone oxidoreductase chain 5 [Alphaproteobacteria bacterium MarineAlpha5_Bin9]|nr:MAG: NADH-quinone oxidoreductase chain 5 [Alphaproteobacteria bacterium MarineAlpha5_Bin9]|tara:strand:+ start:977 stop:1594 length:618 start_codon:yes stop_codon:yes gene_type:complete
MISIESFKKNLSNDFIDKLKIYKNSNYIGLNFESKLLKKIILELKANEKLKFNQLIDLTAVDFPSREKRFDIIYLLLSLKLNTRVLLRISINENENVDSLYDIFQSSNWYERECYDLFGIQFNGHPDLRRIMTDYNFEGFPLRKDFPLTGHNEVRYDHLEEKIVYEPVDLTQEYRDFDNISPWSGITNELKGDEKFIEDDVDEGN